ncbi:autorepressor SdpR family transcription factor [Streptococcus anginosus]|jgi:transcriptional repressor sdpR|uniref:autorepressor SdpR family transcription factor n=1 Tax=Streptococcus anginosus TaxID=1328 RepID=UPI0039C16B9C
MALKNTFKALSDPVRRDILLTLRNNSLTVGEIVEKYNLSNSTISYHLSILKKANLVKEKKYKNYIYYEVNVSVFEDMMVWITQFVGGGEQNEK